MGFTPHKAEQLLQDMDLQEKEENKVCHGFLLDNFDGSQIPVTTGGFERWTSCMQCSYLTHLAIRPGRLGHCTAFKNFAV